MLHDDLRPAMEDPFLWGLSFGYGVTSEWRAELADLQGEASRANSNEDVEMDMLRLDMLYQLPSLRGMRPFVLVGGGKQRFDYGELELENDMANLGIGLDATVNKRLEFRVEVKGIWDLERELESVGVGSGWVYGL